MNSGYNVLRQLLLQVKYELLVGVKSQKCLLGDMKECMKYQKQTLEYITGNIIYIRKSQTTKLL
jgi:hypothetical protein